MDIHQITIHLSRYTSILVCLLANACQICHVRRIAVQKSQKKTDESNSSVFTKCYKKLGFNICTNNIQGTTRFKPLNLLMIIRVVGFNFVFATIGMC